MEEEQSSEPTQPVKKITPLQLREQYHLNIAKLAHKAKVGPSTVYSMVMGYPIAREHAEQILTTISALVGQTYTLDTVQVALLPEEPEQAEATDGALSSDEERTE